MWDTPTAPRGDPNGRHASKPRKEKNNIETKTNSNDMKRIPATLLWASSLLLLLPAASCTDTLGGDPDTDARAITFTPAAETRAAVDDADDMADGFKVWGWYGNTYESTDKNVFDGVTVTKGTDGWGYTGTQYWVPGMKYNFYGVYPVYPKTSSDNGTTATVDNKGKITVTNFDCSKTGEEAVDLMTAMATGDGSDPKPVAMKFQHQLSKVNIVATVEGGNCTITSVTFSGMATQGTYNSSNTSNPWTTGSGTGSFTSNEEKILKTNGVDLLGDLLLIPQTVSGFTLTVDYTVGGVAQPQKVITLPTTISQWEKGQSYKYTLSFKRNTLTVTVKVADWKEEDTSVSWG